MNIEKLQYIYEFINKISPGTLRLAHFTRTVKKVQNDLIRIRQDVDNGDNNSEFSKFIE